MLLIVLLVEMTIAFGVSIPALLVHPRATDSELPFAGMPMFRV